MQGMQVSFGAMQTVEIVCGMMNLLTWCQGRESSVKLATYDEHPISHAGKLF